MGDEKRRENNPRSVSDPTAVLNCQSSPDRGKGKRQKSSTVIGESMGCIFHRTNYNFYL